MSDLAALQARLGYSFRDETLLRLALTHPSVAHEQGAPVAHNQRLEFLGDAVLQLVLSEEIFRRYPQEREGVLTQRRKLLIEGKFAAKLATELRLDECLRVNAAGAVAGLKLNRSALEDAFEALVAALERWPASGVPDNPGAWLMATAKHRAIDLLRRGKMLERKHEQLGQELEARQASPEPDLDAALDDHVGDDLLGLMFTTCHPVLTTEARVALTLRVLGGLTTDEIARAFLVPERTVAQRIVRGKRTLREARVPFEVPRGAELRARLSSVLEVLYLIFNEGYAASSGEALVRAYEPPDGFAKIFCSACGSALWSRHPDDAEVTWVRLGAFDADPEIVGRTVHLGSTAYTVVGVMPEGFVFPLVHEYWIPWRMDAAAYEPRSGPSVYVFGRLAPGASIELSVGIEGERCVVRCADRGCGIAPEDLGRIFVVRTAGNVVDPVALGSIEYAVEHLHAPLVIVMGHESCGACGALPPAPRYSPHRRPSGRGGQAGGSRASAFRPSFQPCGEASRLARAGCRFTRHGPRRRPALDGTDRNPRR